MSKPRVIQSNMNCFDLRRVLLVLLTTVGVPPAWLSAQPVEPISGSDIPAKFEPRRDAYDYTRREEMIPMRDGVRLFTIVLIPKQPRVPMPIVLTRTPYDSKKRTDARETASPLMAMALRQDDEPLVRNGYVRVYQDVRGKHGSEGDYIVNLPLRGPLNPGGVDHATDTWDTIDWLVRNVPGNNGRVGITGISYDGFLTLTALFEPHPALKAAIPINAMVDTWIGDDWYHNGALRQTMIEWIYAQTATKKSEVDLPFGYYDLYAAFLDAGSAGDFGRRYGADQLPAWNRVIENPAYTGIWQHQAVQKLLERIELKVPTLTVHSLFDQEDIYGPIASYEALEKKDRNNDLSYLVIGPWHHGQIRTDGSSLGQIPWHSDTALFFREKVRQPFWDHHLKGIAPQRPPAPVLAFETGANEWRDYATWPPRYRVASTRMYLHANGALSFDVPTAAERGFSEYVSDPAKPVPYRVRPILRDSAPDSTWRLWLADDQRPVSDRPDVLSFVSAPLTEPLTISGGVRANLFASTSGTDGDWVVKLIDVYPEEHPPRVNLGGYQLMISADILRGRYRESFDAPRPITPGETLSYRINMPHANHTFLPGHRIMVQIQSSWFPLYDRNPQTFVANIAWAKAGEYQRATQRIHHSAESPSSVELPVLRTTPPRPIKNDR
jgi:putative CocE/NonD family hydrolase